MHEPRRVPVRRPLLAAAAATAALALAAPLLGGCNLVNRMLGKATVNLDKAEIKSMSVDIRKERKTICPREPVQMAVFADVVLDGESQPKSYETWSGRDANKNDKLDFVEFAFQSDLGQFDKEGFFAPRADLLASADKEFAIRTVFKKQPDKFTFTTKYKPDYQCIKGGGHGGDAGNPGGSGQAGESGHDGQLGSDSQAGGTGSQGSAGGSGGDGGNGGPGPHVQAFATVVKTPYYDKLVAIKLTGEVEDFLLAPVDAPIVLRATGGPGGSGGNGGSGGRGGNGGGGNPGGQGGNGGQGGGGGRGGAGGAGGSIELVFDGRYPDLASAIKLDVSGGPGGEAGAGGGSGSGGSGGNGITPSGSSSPAPSGQHGSEGTHGPSGAAGKNGPDGHASSHAGRAADAFQGLAGITPLDGGGGVGGSGASAGKKGGGSK